MDVVCKLYGTIMLKITLTLTDFLSVIVLQMFIAVINENFDVAEEAKKGKQASNYWEAQKAQRKVSWMRKLNPYRWVKANPVTVHVEHLPSNLILPMQKTLVQDYNLKRTESRPFVSFCFYLCLCCLTTW